MSYCHVVPRRGNSSGVLLLKWGTTLPLYSIVVMLMVIYSNKVNIKIHNRMTSFKKKL